MRSYTVDDEMATEVQKYLDKIREYAAGNVLLVEERVPIDAYTEEEGASGTADVIILDIANNELQAHDLKYGRGVRVDAQNNEQLMLYLLGALYKFGALGDFKRVRGVIHQPRLDHLSEWDCTVEELLAFAERVTAAAREAHAHLECTLGFALPARGRVLMEAGALTPGEKQCQWCKAKASCPALAATVSDSVFASFEVLGDCAAEPIPAEPPDDLAKLGVFMTRLELIEDWCRAIRAKVESNLVSNVPVPGWKLVEGKRGNRKWQDEKAAEELLKAMRLKREDMYDFSVISPTDAEKLFKKQPRKWARVSPLITQGKGKPSVAPESDKRPAIMAAVATSDDFSNLT